MTRNEIEDQYILSVFVGKKRNENIQIPMIVTQERGEMELEITTWLR